MSWWKNRRSADPQLPSQTAAGDTGTEICEEAGAFLLGRSAELFSRRREMVPWWAWLNAVAHRGPRELAELARNAGEESGSGAARGPLAAAVIAAALLKQSGGEEAAVSRLQRDRLIPLELELLCGKVQVANPGQLLHLALVALHTGRCPNSG